ncbi:MAG: CopD family protein, partial [Gammaproteobacteria bacterium]
LKIMREFRAGTAQHSHVFYRWINEIPALLLIAIVLLAVVKPF